MPHDPKKKTGVSQRTKDIMERGFSLEGLDTAIRQFNQGGTSAPQQQGPVLNQPGQLPPVQQVGQPGTGIDLPPQTTTETTSAPSQAITGEQGVAGGGVEDLPGGFTGMEISAFQQAVEDSVFNGNGVFPRGALRYHTNAYGFRELTEESLDLLDYWKELRTDRDTRQKAQQEQSKQQQTFMQSLLGNPAAMAAFQLQSLMSGGRGQFQGGVVGLPQGQLPGAAGKFGFSPYQQERPGFEDEGGDMPGSTGAVGRGWQPVGAPTSNFFQGGVPTLGSLGGPQNQDLQGLLGMLSLFGISPQEFQKQSAMVTPRPVSAGGGRVALAAGRR